VVVSVWKLSLGKSNYTVFGISFSRSGDSRRETGMADIGRKDARIGTEENFKKFLAIGLMADIL
jgi:hypothetical protein